MTECASYGVNEKRCKPGSGCQKPHDPQSSPPMPSAAATTKTGAFVDATPRAAAVDRARQGWISRLIDLSQRNNLLYFRALKVGTLDLTLADRDALAELLSGKSVGL